MSMDEHADPQCTTVESSAIELIVHGRPRDLGGFVVRRLLPSAQRKQLGPFVFFDHMGPVTQSPGQGMDVRPHPHIALATVTYLFEGAIFHRDSLGSAQSIEPGDVNWMVAGRGIVHSERSAPEVRARGQRLHGIQAWVALPKDDEECEPAFFHHAASALPEIDRPGVRLRVIAGSAFGERSPVAVASKTLYVDAALSAGSRLAIPTEHEERAVYVASGSLRCNDEVCSEGTLVVLREGSDVCVEADVDTRAMLLGGAPLDGPRFIEWNFVASRKERIEEAKDAWRKRKFPSVPGDEDEFIPLP
jgi:redox-sensitive bicupin YhaK (pirin superfamily)